jgi:hypothetical protein
MPLRESVFGLGTAGLANTHKGTSVENDSFKKKTVIGVGLLVQVLFSL